MTKRQRDALVKQFGFVPCFHSWCVRPFGLHVHTCNREADHDGRCVCCCGASGPEWREMKGKLA